MGAILSVLEYIPGVVERLRPRTVVADVNIGILLSDSFPRTEAKLEVLWRPREETDIQCIYWADNSGSLGWHRDDDHPDLGTTHFQLQVGDELIHEPGQTEVEAPLSFPEICLNRLPDELQKTAED